MPEISAAVGLIRGSRVARLRDHVGFVVAVALATCKGVGTAPVASVVVTPGTADVMGGETKQLTAKITDAAGGVLTGRSVTWTTDNPAVASVSTAGNVMGVYTGTATIVATSEGQHATAAISVRLVFSAVSAGGSDACAVTPAAGAAFCWGNNFLGQLGTSPAIGPHECNFNACSRTPLVVPGGITFTAVSASSAYTCGLATVHTLYCWGVGSVGQLGNGSTTGSPTFGAVSSALTFTGISAGETHACAVATSGAVYCWGANLHGELGNGTTTNSAVPVATGGGLTFGAVSAGSNHTCGITTMGAAYCWGWGLSGELGDSSFSDSFTPVAVAHGLTFASISAGANYSCGVTTSAVAYCWGANSLGRFGNGGTLESSVPTPVAGGLAFLTVSTGYTSTCGVTTDGAGYCWGANAFGELGDGTTTSSLIPVGVTGGLTFATINTNLSDAAFYACGVTTSGGVYCWGTGGNGELGNGTTGVSHVPVKVVGQP